MARVYYVDVAIPADKKKRGKYKTHAVFDGSRVFRVKKLIELEDAGEIYVDALFPELYGEVLELLRRGIKVYLLKDVTKLKKLRMENNLKKSDENDVMLLSRVSRNYFRVLTIKEMERKIELDALISNYERLTRRIKILKQWIKDEVLDYGLRGPIKQMKREKKDIAKKIIKTVSNNVIYKEACKRLGIKRGSIELAILTVKLPLHLPLQRLKGLLGFVPDRNKARYNHKLRKHVASFAASLYMGAKKGVNFSDEVTEIINRLPKKQAIYKLELMTLKALRIAHRMATKPPAGE